MMTCKCGWEGWKIGDGFIECIVCRTRYAVRAVAIRTTAVVDNRAVDNCMSVTPEWFGEHNIEAEDKQLWPHESPPDVSPGADSPVRNRGIDLSRPFTLQGKTFQPFPGMKPNYFRGPAPDLGALQYGEKSSVGPRSN